MPLGLEAQSLIAGFVALALAGLDTVPAIRSIVARVRHVSSHQDHPTLAKTAYLDEDGEATEGSLQAFSDLVQRLVILLSSVCGFLTTLALGILTTTRYSNNGMAFAWQPFSIWSLLSLQAIAFFTEPRPTERFKMGQFAFVGSLLAIFFTGVNIYLAWPLHESLVRDQVWACLTIVHLASAALRGLFCILLPRRPDVFRDGQEVDRELTVTALGRYTFSWANCLLDYAIKNRSLTLGDLPILRAEKCAELLHRNFEAAKGSRKLWQALVIVHWRPLLLQFFLTLAVGILSFSPQMVLFNILTLLESRGRSDWSPLLPAAWVIALGGLMLLHSLFEAWLLWAVCSKLFVPIYVELSAIIFAKSMRCKDIKHTKPTTGGEGDPNGFAVEVGGDQQGAVLEKSRQSTINLAAVDARRISDFTSYAYLIPSATVKVSIGCGLLINILGWRSALAGMAVSLLITPLNAFVAKKYANSQGTLMRLRDQKIATVTELLQGIRQIKFSGLEKRWQRRIEQAREKELAALWTSFMYDLGLMGVWILGPVGLSAVSLTVYAVLHGGLTASVAFTAISIFGSLEISLAILPEIISKGLDAKVSAARIDAYMATQEKTVNTIPADDIVFESANVAWPTAGTQDVAEHGRFVLRDLNLKFPKKGLSVICGRTGSGKTLLLSSILGECDILSGIIKVPVPPPVEERCDDRATTANWLVESAIAYVSQVPWIENATIRDNILFGLPYNETRYRQVIFACALQKDLDMLPDGESTDIGPNGVNLSGGQRWRLSFARALYSRAEILIMDDIFSALDAQTGRHVYEHALVGELSEGRTRILATHHTALCLPKTDYLVMLENGSVKYADAVGEHGSPSDQDQGESHNAITDGSVIGPKQTVPQKAHESTSHQQAGGSANGGKVVHPKRSLHKKFVEDEKREVGSVQLSFYTTYLTMGGHPLFWIFTILVFFCYASLMVGRGWWVKVWTGSADANQDYLQMLRQSKAQTISASDNYDLEMYMSVYIGICVLACTIGIGRFYFMLSGSIHASRNLFNRLTYVVLRAPLRWLDTVPLGRILNRFTSDFHMIDSSIPYELGFFCSQVLDVCGIVLTGVLVSPLAIVIAGILLTICLTLSRKYLAGAREIKRLESTAKSPIFDQFGVSLAGLTTIRAFSKSDTFIKNMYSKINAHAQAWWTMWLFNRWLAIRMSFIGAVFSTCTAALVVSLPDISAPLAGLALSFAFLFNTTVSLALRQYANIEMNMNAIERVVEYTKIETEPQGGVDAPAAWPTEGRLEVNNLVVGYAPDLPPVLRGLSFVVESSQRVGVVGRTGASKSSLTLALFRLLEARQGQILIDGLDISKIKLHDLRSRLAIIPQDPVLFSGTVRFNLDPFDEYSDTELYDALARVHLISGSSANAAAAHQRSQPPTVPNVQGSVLTSLDGSISEGGLNLSQGQRQLLCLARAILSRPKIMVLDEATSAVDRETDALIQQSLRAEFGRNATTLLVIAHRLSSIADFDRVLVLDAGKAVEFGAPKDLMNIENGVFRNLVNHSGERDVLERVILG
ncbi:P-loop containing nucleoside triphosphate hydrolase protein [Aspergillus bertholletiae]|uniref:P-loop containing nucleoside triphosphate hydrolase protein n=1 Tax=Aspergillus bertholletiae TaxID=1226010 RepID=A0A5N7BP77_9EURO|nr:P-loop containing nucleoside triphosphate hydrolase protein [Aspergillus bertholletiae]